MDDAFVVRGGQALRDLRGVFDGSARGQGAVVHFDAERMSFEKFREEVGRAVVFADVVDGEDVWMVQRGDGAGFLLEAAEAVGVFRKSFREDFDGYVAAEAGVFCTEDFAHSASADWGDNFVGAEFSAAGECHRLPSPEGCSGAEGKFSSQARSPAISRAMFFVFSPMYFQASAMSFLSYTRGSIMEIQSRVRTSSSLLFAISS